MQDPANDVDMCLPIGNLLTLVVVVCFFALQMTWDSRAQHLSCLVLTDWSLTGMLGYMWLHTGFIHVLENIIMLWIVGRRVSIKLGCLWYCLAYLGLGLFAAIVHLACHGQPAVGASGAVMGIFGMYVVLCCRRLGRYAPFLIVCWYLLSIWAGFLGGPVRIHWTHAGSFTAGMCMAIVFMAAHKAPVDDTALSLVGILDRWGCRLLIRR